MEDENVSGLYDNPKYYEIAFSFRDIPTEVNVFEECIKRFSQISVKSVLELACGNSPHMEELVKRGYQYTGLDLSVPMLEYSRKKASRTDAKANLIHRNIVDFSLDTNVDFVYILLDSLYAKNTYELTNHFNQVARVLRRGVFTCLIGCIQYDPSWNSEGEDSWEIERDSIRIKTTVSWKVINRVEQTYKETIVLEVNDHDERINIVDKSLRRAIYPQEFLLMVFNLEHFEFVGWWNNWDLGQPRGLPLRLHFFGNIYRDFL
jgi:SAM-dependent methyltransferase